MAENVPWTLAAILIAVTLIAGGAFGGYFYWTHRPMGSSAQRLVQLGDNVTVDYIGQFGTGPQDGRVFDTSIYSVAANDAAYPKSLEYHTRGVAKNYSTLAVHVGGNTPSSGYSLGNLSFIQVVTGFWQGIVGMAPNQSRVITVTPALGYGPTITACTGTYPLSYRLPVFQTLAGPAFASRFPGQVATTGAQFNDPHYGWTVLILSANSSQVSIENLAKIGDVASPQGWQVEVTNVTSTPGGNGSITVENQLTPGDTGKILGYDYAGTGPCSSQSKGKFFISAVDVAKGTYTENFNSEVQGETLIFTVTVIDVFVPVAKVA
ncbi:MAG: FKBP-type peptidyl-prolyl cis-trans isomerase [Thermoplasmata archaeon]|nr:FKBP-type peptidyl-prolyl cis-trans isomerase [Thermoplasmata archaeon]